MAEIRRDTRTPFFAMAESVCGVHGSAAHLSKDWELFVLVWVFDHVKEEERPPHTIGGRKSGLALLGRAAHRDGPFCIRRRIRRHLLLIDATLGVTFESVADDTLRRLRTDAEIGERGSRLRAASSSLWIGEVL